jgi:hypothetical protein
MVIWPRTYEISPAFEHARGERHSGAPHAQHLGQELLGERERGLVDPIVGHQQPAGAALLHRVGAVAGGVLRHLVHQRERVAQQQAV